MWLPVQAEAGRAEARRLKKARRAAKAAVKVRVPLLSSFACNPVIIVTLDFVWAGFACVWVVQAEAERAEARLLEEARRAAEAAAKVWWWWCECV